jgi:hypothetical protein
MRIMKKLHVKYDEFTVRRRAGASFLNLAAGLGSYTIGDWGGGLVVTAAMEFIPIADNSGIKSVQFLCNWHF